MFRVMPMPATGMRHLFDLFLPLRDREKTNQLSSGATAESGPCEGDGD